ncbi:hypothetical protein GN958_ATG20088 [Phytophthora infestans]|uniref:Secreted RxLR effector peptide protein n=1 Tax=Phytophthora infestans TaxID=4787 RepID=A0A8S9TT73_PHYIN|nr:hypothetical protein GN958_ATG20088 [Phytophthora infestans]
MSTALKMLAVFFVRTMMLCNINTWEKHGTNMEDLFILTIYHRHEGHGSKIPEQKLQRVPSDSNAVVTK